MHDAIKELIDLVGDRQLIDNWTKKWILEVTHEQDILNKNYVSSSYHDFICEHVTSGCLDKMIENDGVKINTCDKSYAATITCLKNRKDKF